MLTTDERITAWLDGELAGKDADDVSMRYAADKEFAARVDEIRRLDALVRSAVPLEAELPPELLAQFGRRAAGSAEIVNLGAVRTTRAEQMERRTHRRFRHLGSGRRAASIAILVGIGISLPFLTNQPVPNGTSSYRTLSDTRAAQVTPNAILMFGEDVSPSEARAIAGAVGARLLGAPTETGVWKVAIASDRRDLALAKLRANPQVAMAEPLDGDTR